MLYMLKRPNLYIVDENNGTKIMRSCISKKYNINFSSSNKYIDFELENHI